MGIVLIICLGLSACSPPKAASRLLASPQDTDPIPSATLPASPSPTVIPSPTQQPSPVPSATQTKPPTQTASPTPLSCWKKGGRIESGSLDTDLLRLPLIYRIYLPPCYSEQPERRYPVLYLFHGQSYSDDQWDRLGADEAADTLIGDGEVQPFIIVMPYERYGGQPTDTKFDQAFIELLIPYIDESYRTLTDRTHRAIGGLSRGAGWAAHFAIAHWKLFSILGVDSPAIFYSDAQEMRTWLDEIPPDSYPRIFVDIGDRDRPEIMESAVWFEKVLNEKNIPHNWYLFSGYHSEAYWSAHVMQYLRWYAQDW